MGEQQYGIKRETLTCYCEEKEEAVTKGETSRMTRRIRSASGKTHLIGLRGEMYLTSQSHLHIHI